MSTRFEQLERTQGVVYGVCAGIWVMTLFAEPKLADMNAARPTLETMARRHPKGFPTLTWVLPEAGFKMESDARKAASDITREYRERIIAQATLIEGSGFQVAAVRAIVAGLDLVSRSSAPKKVFAEVGVAVAWCLSKAVFAGARPEEARMTDSLLKMRSTIADAS